MDSDFYDSDYSEGAEDEEQSAEYMSESEDDDIVLDTQAEVASGGRQVKYRVMNEVELRDRQKEAVNTITSILSITDSDAAKVLRAYKWDVNRVNEEWFNDTERVQEKVGMVESAPVPSTSGSKTQCLICFDDFARDDMCAATCQHYFCKDCWKGYVSNGVGTGPNVLNLRCPLPGCKAAVPNSIINEVATARWIARQCASG